MDDVVNDFPRDTASDLVTQAARLVREVRQQCELPATVRVLSVLDERGPLSVTQLAAAYSCSQPTMTGLVNALLEQGWATKEPHPSDTRSALVVPTAAGVAELGRVRERTGALVSERLAAHPELTTTDLQHAVDVLRAVLTREPVPMGAVRP